MLDNMLSNLRSESITAKAGVLSTGSIYFPVGQDPSTVAA
jgi:hypothetical protein